MAPEFFAFLAVGLVLGGVALATEWFDFGGSQQQAAAPTASIARDIPPGQQPQLAEAVKKADRASQQAATQGGRAGWQWRSDGGAVQAPTR